MGHSLKQLADEFRKTFCEIGGSTFVVVNDVINDIANKIVTFSTEVVGYFAMK